MVRGYKSSAGWCFPRGKININEPELTCAIREVYEETGFDLTNYIKDGERDRIQTQINAQTVTMFIAMGVREGTRFEARTKKEIGVSGYEILRLCVWDCGIGGLWVCAAGEVWSCDCGVVARRKEYGPGELLMRGQEVMDG